MKLPRILKAVKDYIFPNACLSCRNLIDENAFLCLDCWKETELIGQNICNKCGDPLEFEIENELICGRCIRQMPIFNKSVSVFIFKGVTKEIIHKFKYEDQLHIAKKMVKLMLLKGQNLIEDSEIIAPVPMHFFKVLKRNYNQSAILAREIAENTDLSYVGDLLVKTKNTKPQFSLKYNERMQNLKDSFKTQHKYLDLIKGKNILLIDDVTTTGATLNSCAKTLLDSGCKSVNVITLAKTKNL